MYQHSLDAEDIKKFLSKRDNRESEGAAEVVVDGDRIQGLGHSSAPSRYHQHIERLSHTEKQILRLKENKERVTDIQDEIIY